MRFPVFSSLLLDLSRCFYLLFLAALPGVRGCQRPALTIQAPGSSAVPLGGGNLSGHLPSHCGLGCSPEGIASSAPGRAGLPKERWAAGSPTPAHGPRLPRPKATCAHPVSTRFPTRSARGQGHHRWLSQEGTGCQVEYRGNLNFSSFGSISQAIFGTYLYFYK